MDKPKQIIVVRTDLNMRKGKMIAQGSHASMMFMTKRLEFGLCIVSETRAEIPERALGDFNEDEREWMQGKFTKVVVGIGSEAELLELHKQAEEAGLTSHYVVDEGLTEFKGVPTITALAIGPDRSSKIDKITGHLKLL